LRGIRRRATPELSEALETAKISFMRAETLSRLGAQQQRRILAREQLKEDAQRLAAEVLHDFLAQRQRIDLMQIADAIRLTVSQAQAGKPPGPPHYSMGVSLYAAHPALESDSALPELPCIDPRQRTHP
jgi:hypothetical protein